MATTGITFAQARVLLTPSASDTNPVCYDLDAVETLLGVQYTPEQRSVLQDNIPFTEEVLRESAGTHMLFPGFPVSIVGMKEANPVLFYTRHHCYFPTKPPATGELVRASWYLLRMEPVPGAFSKSYPDQVALLSKNDEVPRACEVIFGALLHFLGSGTKLFSDTYARCMDPLYFPGSGDTYDHCRFYIGGLSEDRPIILGTCWEACKFDYLGLASVRKS